METSYQGIPLFLMYKKTKKKTERKVSPKKYISKKGISKKGINKKQTTKFNVGDMVYEKPNFAGNCK